MEIVYTIKDISPKEDTGRYAGIDIGVDNLLRSVTYDGRGGSGVQADWRSPSR